MKKVKEIGRNGGRNNRSRKLGVRNEPAPDVDLAALDLTLDVSLSDAILAAAAKDTTYCRLMKTPPEGTTVHSGLLWESVGDRLFVPSDSALRTRILTVTTTRPVLTSVVTRHSQRSSNDSVGPD